MTRNNRLPEGDDGRVIADMNVEGMPWYTPDKAAERPSGHRDQLDKVQARIAAWGALKAALAVCTVFSIGIVLFVLFCLHVWFRV